MKKTFSLLYPDRGIAPNSGYIPRSVPFSSLIKTVVGGLTYLDQKLNGLSTHPVPVKIVVKFTIYKVNRRWKRVSLLKFIVAFEF